MSWERESDIYLATTVPEMVLRGWYFQNWTTDFSNVASHMIACAAAATNHKTATLLFADLSSFKLGEVAVEFYILNL
jgi:serine protease inhibitor ecotin